MVTVVRASSGQLKTVLALVERLLAELSTEPDEFNGLDVTTVGPQLLDASNQFVAFLAIDTAGEPVGVATLTEAVAAYAGGRYGIISELYVEPNRRSQGVGRQLLDAIRREAQSRGWHRVDVAAPPDERW